MAATLADIRKKVRLITRSPSVSQLSDNDIDDYVNNFLLYDFPEHLRLFTFRKVLKFYTDPYIADYDTTTSLLNQTDPLYNFKNAYITTHDPVYIGGYKAYFTQSRNDFYSLYPSIQSQIQIGTGDGVTTFFSGTLSATPMLMNNVIFTSYDTNNEGLVLNDTPTIDPGTGHKYILGKLCVPNTGVAVGSINYATGDYSFTFPAAPAASAQIYAQVVQRSTGRPMAMLYFDNTFTLRPTPDKVYEVSIETYVRPESLEDAADEPLLEQHWQYISYGASLRIFQDRMDLESVQMIMPEFKQQELLCQRRTIVQQSNERVGTIYTQQIAPGYGDWNNYY